MGGNKLLLKKQEGNPQTPIGPVRLMVFTADKPVDAVLL
jgi:hypothetical protein